MKIHQPTMPHTLHITLYNCQFFHLPLFEQKFVVEHRGDGKMFVGSPLCNRHRNVVFRARPSFHAMPVWSRRVSNQERIKTGRRALFPAPCLT